MVKTNFDDSEASLPGTVPLITVITPVFNGEGYIGGCLENVIAQGCSRVEHLVMDGGSTDRTVEILRNYRARYSHLQWRSERDRGQSDAMNKGVRLAAGRLLTFLNTDDFYSPGVLNRVCDLAANRPGPVLLVGDCRVIDEKDQFLWLNRPTPLHIDRMLLGPGVNHYPVNPSAYFYDRVLHDLVGPYREDEHFHMDLEFLLRAVPAAQVEQFPETWGNFRLFPGTKSHGGLVVGDVNRNVSAVLAPFHDMLPWPKRVWFRLLFRFFNGWPYARLAGAAREPWAVPAKIFRRFRAG